MVINTKLIAVRHVNRSAAKVQNHFIGHQFTAGFLENVAQQKVAVSLDDFDHAPVIGELPEC